MIPPQGNGDFAAAMERVLDVYRRPWDYADAERITPVMDNLNTHRPGALYATYPPAQAKALWDRFEFIYTPKHGSWLKRLYPTFDE